MSRDINKDFQSEIGKAAFLREKIQAGGGAGSITFSGLSDTPSGYNNGQFLKSTSDGIIYTGVSFLSDISDRPTTQLVSGFLALDAQGELIWRLPTSGDITYSISGATHITGLLDTPSDYQSGKYLVSTDAGIEYRDITGLSKDLAEAQAIDFTGLSGTPSNYEQGKFLVSNSSGIAYTGITSEDIQWQWYSDTSSLPSASENHGMFAHVHSEGAAYMAHAGQWEKIYPNNGGGGSGGSSDGGLGSNVNVRSASNFYTDLPDSIIVKHDANDTEFALTLAHVQQDYITYRTPILHGSSDVRRIYFDNNQSGDFNSQFTNYFTGTESLKDYIDNGRALYFGGGGSSTFSASSYQENILQGHITTDNDANLNDLHFTGLETGAYYRLGGQARFVAGFNNAATNMWLYAYQDSFATDNIVAALNNRAGGDADPVNATHTFNHIFQATGDLFFAVGGMNSSQDRYIYGDGTKPQTFVQLEKLGSSSNGGGGSGGNSSTSNGGIGDSAEVINSSNFGSKIPDVILLHVNNKSDQPRLYHFFGIDNDPTDNAILYRSNANQQVSFVNNSAGDFDATLTNATHVRYAGDTTLQSIIDNGHAIYLGGGSSSSNGSSSSGGLGSSSSCSSGVTDWSGISDISNLYTGVPENIFIEHSNGYYSAQFQNLNSVGIVYSLNPTENKYLTFNNNAEGTFNGGNYTNAGSTQTWTANSGPSLSGLISAGYFHHGGGCSSSAGAGGGGGGGAGGGVQNFTGLIDTPNTYQPNRFIKVNQANNGLEYTDPLSQSNNINDGESIVSNSTEGKVKRVKAGNNINLLTSQDSLTINANIPAANTSFFGLTDTPSSVVANQFLIGDDQGNLSFSPIDLSSPVGSGFASNFNIVDTKTFYTKIPENIYATNNSASIKEVFKFHKHDAGNSIEYIGSGDKNIVFDDDISGSYSSSNLPAHLDGNNNLSLSGYIDQGRSHYEAARNTGVFNQGLRAVLSAGASEIFNDIQSPKLQNIKGDNNYFTAISYSSQVNNEAQWTVPPALTKNFLDGEVEVDIIWTSEATNGDVKWELQICPISIGVNIDQASSEPYRTIISSGPTAANNLCKGTIKFEPTVNEMQSSDFLILKVKRNALASEDNLNGEAKLIFLSLIEEI